jgi:ATP-binding cassette, subfamily B, bacterial CvaB/MchF/RaxB
LHGPWIFQSINLTIEPGQCVVLYGPSGTGKSTLFKILMGLVKPTSGEMLLNGQQVDGNALQTYRQQIAGVMQNDRLFIGSIYENINFFDEHIDFQRIEECAKQAEIHDDIMQMPMGYHSYLGDMESALSGGQKQRILLARALYRQPNILFLDEAFSNLDIATEAKLNQNLSKLSMTRVIITHRTESLTYADKVIDIRHLVQVLKKAD